MAKAPNIDIPLSKLDKTLLDASPFFKIVPLKVRMTFDELTEEALEDQSFPASSPCFLCQTFCFFVAISLFFRFFLIVLCRKRSKYLAFFPKNTTFASANLS